MEIREWLDRSSFYLEWAKKMYIQKGDFIVIRYMYQSIRKSANMRYTPNVGQLTTQERLFEDDYPRMGPEY